MAPLQKLFNTFALGIFAIFFASYLTITILVIFFLVSATKTPSKVPVSFFLFLCGVSLALHAHRTTTFGPTEVFSPKKNMSPSCHLQQISTTEQLLREKTSCELSDFELQPSPPQFFLPHNNHRKSGRLFRRIQSEETEQTDILSLASCSEGDFTCFDFIWKNNMTPPNMISTIFIENAQSIFLVPKHNIHPAEGLQVLHNLAQNFTLTWAEKNEQASDGSLIRPQHKQVPFTWMIDSFLIVPRIKNAPTSVEVILQQTCKQEGQCDNIQDTFSDFVLYVSDATALPVFNIFLNLLSCDGDLQAKYCTSAVTLSVTSYVLNVSITLVMVYLTMASSPVHWKHFLLSSFYSGIDVSTLNVVGVLRNIPGEKNKMAQVLIFLLTCSQCVATSWVLVQTNMASDITYMSTEWEYLRFLTFIFPFALLHGKVFITTVTIVGVASLSAALSDVWYIFIRPRL